MEDELTGQACLITEILGILVVRSLRFAIMLRSASSRIVVNGSAGNKIMHARGLRQGDPILPLLFVIAMDVLTTIISKGESEGVLSSLPGCALLQRLSIFADDVVLFIKPTVQDLDFVREAFHIFGNASGLHINYSKSSAILIRSDDSEKLRVASALPWKIDNFPCRYLGLQLAIG